MGARVYVTHPENEGGVRKPRGASFLEQDESNLGLADVLRGLRQCFVVFLIVCTATVLALATGRYAQALVTSLAYALCARESFACKFDTARHASWLAPGTCGNHAFFSFA